MVEPMKSRGLNDVQKLRRRLIRLHGLRRVGEDDFMFINNRLKEVEARIVNMKEYGPRREEVF